MTPTILVATTLQHLSLVSSLKIRNYRLTCRTSGIEALAYLRERTPDLMILDGELSGMSGLDICYRAKKVSRLRHIPVILLLSGKDTERRQIEATLVGAERALHHPVSGLELCRAIEGLLQKVSPRTAPEVRIPYVA